MATTTPNTGSINPVSSGFETYLDFKQLRTQSIEYLAQLTGKIWTDYNAHDPGITILEMLCYAVLDLGYRNSLPIADILARAPGDATPDNNFFTPGQILACNPLTILDYRKLLVDLEGVRNAWLEVADDQTILCRETVNSSCQEFLNGLYHVYLELEDNTADKQDQIVAAVRKALITHRNLCEDFVDIHILCSMGIGVCADIELLVGADTATVYQSVILALETFFSTAPTFYTLQELLAKGKPIEDIFAGRPYDLTQSHGFVDTDEFERIVLKKEIHLSDIYQVLLAVKGVKTVRRLRLQVCGNDPVTAPDSWVFVIPKNYVPEFSLTCSGFQFTQNNRPVQIDLTAFSSTLGFNFSAGARIRYTQPSPYLDAAIPKGVYRDGLGDYYSIQNEFPRVYGIGQGGLPDDVSDKRKAQALQLKGYLLFFDQLLANYVVQLQNTRSLFALGTPSAADQHTYFAGQLGSVPDLDPLLALSSNTALSTGIPATASLLQAIKNGAIAKKIFDESSKPVAFDTLVARDLAVYQWVEDAVNNNLTVEVLNTGKGCFFFYLVGSSGELVLLSRNSYGSAADALTAGNLIRYSATNIANYNRHIQADGVHFSFSVEINIPGYYTYLQQIVEDTALYQTRRGQFLDHLLSRFAEQFADLAILSYGFAEGAALETAVIRAKEGFLSNYPDLSANRGKAFDLDLDGWHNDNVSGFEKRVAGLAGMNRGGNHSLCNFVVEQREDRFIIRIILNGHLLFTSFEKLFSEEATRESARILLRDATAFDNYTVYFDETESRFGVKLFYQQNKVAYGPERFDSPEDATEYGQDVYRLFSRPAYTSEVSKRVFYVYLRNYDGEDVLRYHEFYEDGERARAFFTDAAAKVSDAAAWDALRPGTGPFPHIHLYAAVATEADPDNAGQSRATGTLTPFVDLDGFRILPSDTIVGKPGFYSYALLDKGNHFKFVSDGEFESEQAAREDAFRLIYLLTEERNLVVIGDPRTERLLLQVVDGDRLVAIATHHNNDMMTGSVVQAIVALVRKHMYFLRAEEKPYLWKFRFMLRYQPLGSLTFRSKAEYPASEEAMTAASAFDEGLTGVKELEANCDLVEGVMDKAGEWLGLRNEIRRLLAEPDAAAFASFVENETLNKEQKYIYRLVDKDHLYAWYLPPDTGGDNCAAINRKKKELFQQTPDYEYIDICLGGDNIHARIDACSGATFYHYQLKCHARRDPALQDLVLFESVQGYATEADAQAAFDANYMLILRKGMDPSQYGTDAFISIDEVFVHTTGVCVMRKSVVFIPGQTKKHLTWYNVDQLAEKLIAIVRRYPIRLLTDGKADREEFKLRFPCFSLPTEPKDDCTCQSQPTITSYYFYVLMDTAGNEIWQSVWPITDRQKAREEFDFFLLLLLYPGNYFVDQDPCTCRWKIYIREVLAESTRRFVTKAEAWGDQGIEKFICVSQSREAFHLYFNRKKCGDSFYVACANTPFVHPCRYDTALARDEALTRLYNTMQEFGKRSLPDLFFPHETDFIYGLDGEAIAVFPQLDAGTNFSVYCCGLMELMDYILNDIGFGRNDEGCFIRSKTGLIVAHSLDTEIGLPEWKQKLLDLAYYFPIVKEQDSFCIEIRLPYFNRPENDLADDENCECNQPKKPCDDCWLAWKSTCCYDNCQKAFADYFTLLFLLSDRRNYRPVYDCPCGTYGILLHVPEDIVAFNPQCYLTPDMDCAAVERAKQLINAEGLHVVEHILLRPRTEEDCRCQYKPEACPSQTDCHFKWVVPGADDPCSQDEVICFDPGYDPYSFIATVALPAWPQRFRSAENRQYVEYMLQREAPAHVLLRVLWLAPHDLCCFEGHYKQWLHWMAYARNCDPDYSTCAFLQFLFHTAFECLPACTECPPCKPPAPLPCFADVVAADPNLQLNQIDELFCWQPVDCKKYEYAECRDCEPCGDQPVKAPAVPAGLEPVGLAPAPAVVLEAARMDPPTPPDARERTRFINARYADYKKRLTALTHEVGETTALATAARFLSMVKPTVQKFSEAGDKLIRDTTSGTYRQIAASIISRHFLDKLVFSGGEAILKTLEPVFTRWRAAGIDTAAIYTKWDAAQVSRYEMGLDAGKINKIVTGK